MKLFFSFRLLNSSTSWIKTGQTTRWVSTFGEFTVFDGGEVDSKPNLQIKKIPPMIRVMRDTCVYPKMIPLRKGLSSFQFLQPRVFTLTLLHQMSWCSKKPKDQPNICRLTTRETASHWSMRPQPLNLSGGEGRGKSKSCEAERKRDLSGLRT